MFLPDPKWGKVLSKTNGDAFALQVGTIPTDTALPLSHREHTATKFAQQDVAFTSHGPADVCANPHKSMERSGWREALQTGIGGAGQLEPAGMESQPGKHRRPGHFRPDI